MHAAAEANGLLQVAESLASHLISLPSRCLSEPWTHSFVNVLFLIVSAWALAPRTTEVVGPPPQAGVEDEKPTTPKTVRTRSTLAHDPRFNLVGPAGSPDHRRPGARALHSSVPRVVGGATLFTRLHIGIQKRPRPSY